MKKVLVFVLALLMLYIGFLTVQIKEIKGSISDEEGNAVTQVNKTVTGFSTDLTKVIEQVSQQIVHVDVLKAGQISESCSGVIYSVLEHETIIVASAYMLKDADSVSVTFDNGESVLAEVKGMDEVTDLAVISTQPSFTSMPVTIGKSSLLSLGEWLIAVGNEARSDFSPSVSVGILSGVDRPYRSVMNTDDSYELNVMIADLDIAKGTTGGAVVNMQGELVGIPSIHLTSSEEAIIVPVEEVEEVVRLILENQEVVRPTLGITTQTVSEMTAYQKSQLSIQLDQIEGLYIDSIVRMGPADLALMQVGDILLEFNGTKLEDYNSLRSLLYTYKAGDVVELTVLRGNDTSKVMVTLQ